MDFVHESHTDTIEHYNVPFRDANWNHSASLHKGWWNDRWKSWLAYLSPREGPYRPANAVAEPIEMNCHGAKQAVQDFDPAIGWILSREAMMADATSEGDLLPTLPSFFKRFFFFFFLKYRQPRGYDRRAIRPQHAYCWGKIMGTDHILGSFEASLGVGTERGKLCWWHSESINLR